MKQVLWVLFVTLCHFQYTQSRKVNLTRVMQTTDACTCSNEFVGRIVGGEVAGKGEYPWMVSIFSNGRIHCGGSIINNRYILTAGHCLNWSKKEDLKVVLGLYDRVEREAEERGGVEMEIEKIIVHEDFSSDYLHDTEDIGLIKLKEPIKFEKGIIPVCLPREGESNYTDQYAVVTGWGRTSQSGSPSRLLRRAKVRLMSNNRCSQLPIIGEHITEGMLCAYEESVDACQGDSGGPLVMEAHSRFEQIGVVSWGIGCAKKGVPGIYSRVAYYKEWIVAHTQDATYCHD